MRIAKYGGKMPLSIVYDNCELCCEMDGVDGGYALHAYTRIGTEYLLGKYRTMQAAASAMRFLDKAYENGEEQVTIPDGDYD